MIWLAVACAAVCAAICAAVYWLRFVEAPPSWPGSIAKTASTAWLSLAGIAADAPALIVAGLALGATGDLALSRPGPRAFLAGMAAFAAGHMAYAAQMWSPDGAARLWPAGLPMLALAASTEIWLIPRTGDLRWPVRGYVLVITAMALAALSLPPGRHLALTGAALFILSDLLLAIHLFVRPRPALAHTLWPAYWLGQCLILLGYL